MSDDIEVVRKITARALGCEKEPGQSFVVIGRVSRATAEETNNGPYVKFRGEFEGTNEKNGTRVFSTQFIAPAVGEDLIYNAITQAQADGDKGAMVEFAMRFETVEVSRDKSPIGYEWKAKPLMKLQADDPLARLRAQTADLIHLPAPESDGKKKS